MFRISRRLDYGLQLMAALAANSDFRPESTASLAGKLEMPLPFLHQIAHTLMQAKLVKATPGPRGGLRINQPAEKISILMIVEALEGPVALTPCDDCPETCVRQSCCTTLLVWNDLQERIGNYLGSTTISDLLNQGNSTENYAVSIAGMIATNK